MKENENWMSISFCSCDLYICVFVNRLVPSAVPKQNQPEQSVLGDFSEIIIKIWKLRNTNRSCIYLVYICGRRYKYRTCEILLKGNFVICFFFLVWHVNIILTIYLWVLFQWKVVEHTDYVLANCVLTIIDFRNAINACIEVVPTTSTLIFNWEIISSFLLYRISFDTK